MDTTQEPKVKPTPVCFTPELLADLDREVEREGLFRGRSILIRRACKEYLERRQVTVPEQKAA